MLNAKLWPGYWSEGQVFRMGQEFSATLWTQYWRVGARPRFSPSAGTLKQCGCHPERSEASQLFAPRMEADGWRLVLVGIEDGSPKRKKKGGHKGHPISHLQEISVPLGLTSFLRQAYPLVGGQVPAPAASVFVTCPPCRP